jgi:ketosteroid isomerase-like protein
MRPGHLRPPVRYGCVVVGLVTGLWASPAVAQPVVTTTPDLSNPDVAAIVQIGKDYATAFAAGDYERINSFYSPDVLYMPQGGSIHGASDPKARQKFFAANRGTIDIHVDEAGVSGDLAWERTTFTMTIIPKDGSKTQVHKGRLLEIMRKEGGKWRSWRVMTNDAGDG